MYIYSVYVHVLASPFLQNISLSNVKTLMAKLYPYMYSAPGCIRHGALPWGGGVRQQAIMGHTVSLVT